MTSLSKRAAGALLIAVNGPGAGGDPLPAPAGLGAGFPVTVAR
jgi:hypothetical protein